MMSGLMKLARAACTRHESAVGAASIDYPALMSKHVAGARLFADREELISSLHSAKGGIVAEVGVAAGDFSEFMLDALAPARFVAFDTFKLHEVPVVWGVPSRTLLAGMTHLDFYQHRFGARGDQIAIEIGPSQASLARYPDEHFDLIYIDGDHSYEGVRTDAQIGKSKLKAGGFLVFNDYILVDHVSGQHYGVVPAVHELVVAEDWTVVGFALQHHLFCDIAIRKPARL